MVVWRVVSLWRWTVQFEPSVNNTGLEKLKCAPVVADSKLPFSSAARVWCSGLCSGLTHKYIRHTHGVVPNISAHLCSLVKIARRHQRKQVLTGGSHPMLLDFVLALGKWKQNPTNLPLCNSYHSSSIWSLDESLSTRLCLIEVEGNVVENMLETALFRPVLWLLGLRFYLT